MLQGVAALEAAASAEPKRAAELRAEAAAGKPEGPGRERAPEEQASRGRMQGRRQRRVPEEPPPAPQEFVPRGTCSILPKPSFFGLPLY
jgi:uncharacterized membrane protein